MAKHEPGEESPAQAEEEAGRQNRQSIQGCDAERTKVVKSEELLSRKAAIAFNVPVPKTDTGR